MAIRKFTDRRGEDEGSILVLVLIVSFLLVSSVALSLTTSTTNLIFSSQFGRTLQAGLASRSGIDAELTSMRNVTAYASFPCSLTGSLSVPGALSSYAVTVQYTAGASVLTCAGSTLGGTTVPTAATLVSTGTASHGSTTVSQANVSVSVPAATLSGALGYAIFTASSLNLLNAATVNQSGSNPAPNLYAGQTASCVDGISSQGGLTTYVAITLSGACSLTGSLVAGGLVTMQGSAHVGGAVTAYGGGLSMSGNPSIGGNAISTGGAMSLANSSTISGSADASGSISVTGGSTIGGTQTANDPTLASQTIPAQISFPTLNPTTTQWGAAGWTVVQIPGGAYSTCASYFQNINSGASDPFMTQISTAAAKTVVYAPTCAVTYNNAHAFTLSADVVLQVQSFILQNSNTFDSTSTVVHNFSVLASPSATCGSAVDINFANSTNFISSTPSTNATLNVFIYSPGVVDFADAPAMSGQVLGCGGFTGENSFSLNFVPTAAAGLPWTSTTSSAPTVTVTGKFLLKG